MTRRYKRGDILVEKCGAIKVQKWRILRVSEFYGRYTCAPIMANTRRKYKTVVLYFKIDEDPWFRKQNTN